MLYGRHTETEQTCPVCAAIVPWSGVSRHTDWHVEMDIERFNALFIEDALNEGWALHTNPGTPAEPLVIGAAWTANAGASSSLGPEISDAEAVRIAMTGTSAHHRAARKLITRYVNPDRRPVVPGIAPVESHGTTITDLRMCLVPGAAVTLWWHASPTPCTGNGTVEVATASGFRISTVGELPDGTPKRFAWPKGGNVRCTGSRFTIMGANDDPDAALVGSRPAVSDKDALVRRAEALRQYFADQS